MQLRKLTFLLVTSIFISPAIANGYEIDIRTGNIGVSRSPDGNIYINPGQIRGRVPPYRSNWLINDIPNENIRYRSDCCRRRNFSRQYSRQIRQSGRTITQNQVFSNQCP